MTIETNLTDQIRLHTQLWSHYNLVYWFISMISIFGVIFTSCMLFLVYIFGSFLVVVEIIITSMYFLLSVISYIMFKITAKFHSYKLYEKQRIAELSKDSVREFLPSILNMDISQFGKIQGFITSSILFYFLIMMNLLTSITVFMTMIFSPFPWVPYLVFFILLGFAIILFFPWIQMVKNWRLRKED
ncbi:MAG: hypothetical protein JW776_15365 [Candidatus Lokiarchaeota archaeon]|nr:hypothetical protein [Candidatus Lokiarchaeota archaeon]